MDPKIAALRGAFPMIPGGRLDQLLSSIHEAEQEYEVAVYSTIGGYTTLATAFERFYVESLDHALTSIDGTAPQDWGLLLVECLSVFRTFRVAEKTFRSGYPLAGFVLLRDLKDRAILNAAVLSRISSFRAIWAVAELDGQEDQGDRMRKARKAEESRVRRTMLGKNSGMDASVVKELFAWEQLFHSEVHGSRLTPASEYYPWLQGQEPLRLGPRLRESSSATYFNRATEVGWMWLRLLPHLQWRVEGFRDSWAAKWRLLDEAFAHMEDSLGELGKPIATVFATFMSEKFGFTPGDRFSTKPTVD